MNDQEVKSQARQLVKKVMLSSLATVDPNGFPQTRAMMSGDVDEDFTIYYITGRQSAKCAQIAACPKVSSFWVDVVQPMKDWRSVLIKGEARISDEAALRKRFWMEELRFVFPGGADDPNFVIIVIKPTELIYGSAGMMPPAVVKL